MTFVETTNLLFLSEKVNEQIKLNNLNEVKSLVQEIEHVILSTTDLDVNHQFLSLVTLAKYYKRIRNYDKSANYGRQALNISKQIDAKYFNVVTECYLEHASLEIEYTQYANARKQLAKLLDLLEANNNNDSFLYGLIYNKLANVHLKEEDYQNGLNQLKASLDYFEKAVPKDHPVIEQTIHQMADVFIKVEEYEQAVELRQQLVTTYKQSNDKIKEAETLLSIGENYFYINLRQARKVITRAVTIFEEVYGKKHYHIAKAQFMLAELDENLGNLPRSITYYKRALEQLLGFTNKNHFMIVYAYSKIGTLSLKSNELEQAKDFLEKGLDLSNEFPKIRLQFLNALGKLYSEEKVYEKALTMFQEFLRMLEKDNRNKSKAYADTLQSIAFNFSEQNLIDKAINYYEQALPIYHQLKLECLEEKGLIYIRLAYCYEYRNEKDLELAETFLKKGVEHIQKVRNRDMLAETLVGIIEFYTRNPNMKKKRVYEDKLVKLQLKNQ